MKVMKEWMEFLTPFLGQNTPFLAVLKFLTDVKLTNDRNDFMTDAFYIDFHISVKLKRNIYLATLDGGPNHQFSCLF